MHLTHLPRSLLLLLLTLTLAPPTLAVPSSDCHQAPRSPPHPEDQQQPDLDSLVSRQRRLEAWLAQKPLHTTALLAGAAATAVPKSQIKNGRRRDLAGVTGEKGMWVPAELWDEGDEEAESGGRQEGRKEKKVGDVRGERVLEVGLEDEDLDVEGDDVEGFGVKDVTDVMEWVWMELEKVSSLVQMKTRGVERVQEPDSGHDGDL